MDLKTFYELAGGSYDEVIGRLQMETLIRKYLLKLPDDQSFFELRKALSVHDWNSAFRACHTLKGICGNLGLKRLYEACDILTEKLRNDNDETDLNEAFHLVQKEYERIIDVIDKVCIN